MRWLGAILPIAMSLTVVAAGLIHAMHVGGLYREADEGTAAHLFQLFMPAEVPIIALFAATQLPRDPTWTLRVLALQVAAALAVIIPVFVLDL